MEPIAFMPITHVPGCLKCSRPHKCHPVLCSNNCALALATLAHLVEGLPVTLLPCSSPAVDQTPLAPSEQHPRPLDRTVQSATVPPVAPMTTITTGGLTEHSLAMLATRVGQQDKWLAWDKQQIDKLSQQLSNTTMQLTHISKVLDHLLENHTPMVMMTGAPVALVISSVSGTGPSGQVSAHSHQGTASGKANPSTISLHINRQTAPLSDAGYSQPRQDLQDQAFSLWDQAHSSTLNHSARPFLPCDVQPQFPVSLDPLALG